MDPRGGGGMGMGMSIGMNGGHPHPHAMNMNMGMNHPMGIPPKLNHPIGGIGTARAIAMGPGPGHHPRSNNFYFIIIISFFKYILQ